MELKESRTVNANAAQVWAALLDVDVLRKSVPGCTEMTGSVEEGFDATVVQKVGPVKATFKGRVEIGDMVEPKSLTIQGEGSGGVAGFAKGGASLTLNQEGDRTELEYVVDAKIGGKLAQLGSRVIDPFARKMADQFFNRFQIVLEGGDPDAEAAEKKSKGWFGKKKSQAAE